MSAHYSTLPLPCRAAYFVGRFAAMRDHYVDMARHEPTKHMRHIYARTARTFNHHLLQWVRETRTRIVKEAA